MSHSVKSLYSIFSRPYWSGEAFDFLSLVCDTISGLGITHSTVAASGGFNRTIWSFLRVKGATYFYAIA